MSTKWKDTHFIVLANALIAYLKITFQKMLIQKNLAILNVIDQLRNYGDISIFTLCICDVLH